MRKLIVLSAVAIMTVTLLPNSVEARTRLVYNLVGTGNMYVAPVPDIDGVPVNDALCFDVELQNPVTGQTIGTATDCLANITPVGDGLKLVGTTFFNLPGGTLVTRGKTTVQPSTDDLGSGFIPTFTHITGANAAGNAVIPGESSGSFRNASGTVRLSGMVDMTNFNAVVGDPISFDCLFVIELDTPPLP